MSNLLNALPLQQRQPLRISTDVPLFAGYPSDCSSDSPSSANQCFFHVLCMHSFESSDPIHLSFHKDEVLTIIKQEHSGWWAAMRPQGDRIGWIPGSFVLPLDGSKIVEYPDETLWPYESLNDLLLSAVHDPWVPVSEDYRVSSFQLVTPTDLVLYKGSFDDRVWSHGCESLFDLSNDERSPDMGDICVPPIPESPPPHRTQRPHFPQSPVLSEPALQLTRPASAPPFDTALHHHPRSCGMDGQTPLLCLTTPVSSDDAPELISSLDIEDWPTVLKSVAASQDGTYSDDAIQRQHQSSELLASLRLARPNQGISDTNFPDLTIWGPDTLAERFCVLMHTLYATIRQHDCLDWVTGRSRSTAVTGLQQFFDTHDHIALWVQKSIVAYDGTTQQAEALDFWIRVAEKCQVLRNFDSLCAIVLSLSGSSLSSLGSAWARCTQSQTFATLRNMLDVSNKFRHLTNFMDAAKGPSVPFVRQYLDDIKELHVENTPRQSGYAADAGSSAVCRMRLVAVSNMLRHQSSPYDFKITGPYIDRLVEDELQVISKGLDAWGTAKIVNGYLKFNDGHFNSIGDGFALP